MPRHTLDKWTYKLKTMDVCLTKHRESDIYNHMVKMHKKAEELFEKYDAKYREILKEFNDEENHMYVKYNWRQGDPSRFWMKNADNWYLTDVDEDQKESVRNEYFLLFDIYADFMVCDRHIEEWNDEKPDWSDMVYNVNQFHITLKEACHTIRLYEQVDFMKYKTKWQIEDKDWIEETNRKKEHKNHPIIELPYTTNTNIEPEAYPTEPLRDDCVYCKQHWEDMKPRYAKAIEIWSKNKQEDDEYNAKKEVNKTAIMKVKQFEKSLEIEEDDNYEQDLYCELCNHTSKNVDDYNLHHESERHLKKERFCTVCQLQCKSDYDYKNHLETTKHKKNVGLIDSKPKVFKCSKCDYETITKANYERHCYSKHKE